MTINEPTRLLAMTRRWKPMFGQAIQALSSLKLAVAILVALATVSATGTVVEANYGRDQAQWFVYHSPWFVGLLALLGASVLCAALARWPWKRCQAGLIITQAGLLLLLVGSVYTLRSGMEGQIVLVEGAATEQLTLSQRSQITANWADRPDEPPYVFTFESGPVTWGAGTWLDIGSVDGVRARVLGYVHQGQAVENWAADDRRVGGPRLRFQLEGPQGGQRAEHFLTDQDFGGEVFIGPMTLRLQRANGEAMLNDFLNPPSGELGERGLLTMYYQNHVQRERVDDMVGKTLAIGDTGATVELVQYLTDPKLAGGGQFQSMGEEPRNPAVELRVRLPGEDQPYRQVAFAKSPLLNLDGVYARTCPVKFVYRHPAIAPASAVELLQSSAGKLYCRTISDGEFKPLGEVTTGSRIEAPAKFALTVAEYLPHARRAVSFEPAGHSGDNRVESAPAAQVEISAAGVTQSIWLQRNHPQFNLGTIDTPQGPLHVRFTTARVPLGFSLQLVDFHRQTNPGGAGDAAYVSTVQLVDEIRKVERQQQISLNHPLTYRGLTLYQSDFREAGHGKEAAVFTAAYDPGRVLKYGGSLLICFGMATMFYGRTYSFQSFPRLWIGRSQSADRGQAAAQPDAPGKLKIPA